ncbi:hypothetical protein EBR21_00385 [bacterium]|nr:hypothetical protein [bacterium]
MNRQRILSVFKGSSFVLASASFVTFSSELQAAKCPSQAPFVFREGDTLSEVLWYLGSEPVYGKRGWIEKTWALNPSQTHLRGKEIPPGTKLNIPIKECPMRGGWTLENGLLVAPYNHPKRNNAASKSDAQIAASQGQALSTAAPTASPTPKPTPTASPTPKPTPTASPTPKPTPTVPTIPEPPSTDSPSPNPAATASPAPKPTTTVKPITSPQPAVIAPPASSKQKTSKDLLKNIKESKDAFQKTNKNENEFINNLKNDSEFQIEKKQ